MLLFALATNIRNLIIITGEIICSLCWVRRTFNGTGLAPQPKITLEREAARVCKDPPRPSTPTNQCVEIAPAVRPIRPKALQKAENQRLKIISVCENIHRQAAGGCERSQKGITVGFFRI